MATKKCLESKLQSCKGEDEESVQPWHSSAGALLRDIYKSLDNAPQ